LVAPVLAEISLAAAILEIKTIGFAPARSVTMAGQDDI
jgi:hypothetical protein